MELFDDALPLDLTLPGDLWPSEEADSPPAPDKHVLPPVSEARHDLRQILPDDPLWDAVLVRYRQRR